MAACDCILGLEPGENPFGAEDVSPFYLECLRREEAIVNATRQSLLSEATPLLELLASNFGEISDFFVGSISNDYIERTLSFLLQDIAIREATSGLQCSPQTSPDGCYELSEDVLSDIIWSSYSSRARAIVDKYSALQDLAEAHLATFFILDALIFGESLARGQAGAISLGYDLQSINSAIDVVSALGGIFVSSETRRLVGLGSELYLFLSFSGIVGQSETARQVRNLEVILPRRTSGPQSILIPAEDAATVVADRYLSAIERIFGPYSTQQINAYVRAIPHIFFDSDLQELAISLGGVRLNAYREELSERLARLSQEYCGTDFGPVDPLDEECDKVCDPGEILIGRGGDCRCVTISEEIPISTPADPQNITESILEAIANGVCPDHQLPELRGRALECNDKCQGFHNIWHPDDKCFSYDDIRYMQLGVKYDRREDGKSYIEIQPPHEIHTVVGDQYVSGCPGHRIGGGRFCSRPTCGNVESISTVPAIWLTFNQFNFFASSGQELPNPTTSAADIVSSSGDETDLGDNIEYAIILAAQAIGAVAEVDGVQTSLENVFLVDRSRAAQQFGDEYTVLSVLPRIGSFSVRIVRGTPGIRVFDSRVGECVPTHIWGPSGQPASANVYSNRLRPCDLVSITDCEICINYYYPNPVDDRAEVITSLHEDEVCLNGTVQRKANYCGFIWGLIYNYDTDMCEPACADGMVAESINPDGTYNCRERIVDGDERDTYENYAVEPRAWPLQDRSGNASIPRIDNPVFKSSFIRVDTDDLENIMNDPYYQVPPELIPAAIGRTLAPAL